MKFVYIVVVGYVMVFMFVLGVLVWYLLKVCDIVFVLCFFVVVVGFGLVVIFLVIVLGDELGYIVGEVNKVKLVVIEVEWDIYFVFVGLILFGLFNDKEECIDYVVKIFYVLGLIVICLVDI